MALPANVQTCTVVGRFIKAVVDGVDVDREPDGVPVAGLTVTFTPQFTVARNVAATPPTTIFFDTITATTDEGGVLVGADNVAGVLLVASDDADLDPHGWTYTVAIAGPSIPGITFQFAAPAGETIDLATVIPVPSNLGSEIPAWQAVVVQATTARDEAIAAAASINVAALEANIASKADSADVAAIEADVATKAADADVVKTTGAQTKAGVLTLSSAPVVPDASFTTAKVTGLAAALTARQLTSEKGVANGYAPLGSDNKIPATHLPSGALVYQGTYNAATNTPSLTNGTGTAGHLYKVATAGTRNFGAGAITFAAGDSVIYSGTVWEKSGSTDAVASVAGKTGAVTIDKADVGLANVDDTTDAAKPISNAQAAVNSAQATANESFAPKVDAALTGTPTAPTAALGTATTQIANMAALAAQAAASQAALPEYIQDTVGVMFESPDSSVSAVYNDTTGKVALTAIGGGGGAATLKESLHAAIPTNNATDCGPAFQAIYDNGFELDLNQKITYYINSPVFMDRDTLQNPFVINLNGASLRLGPGLPVITSALSGTTRFAFLPNVKRTAWAGGSASITLTESVRGTGSSGKYGGLIINNGYWSTYAGADTGLVCTYTASVILNGVHQNGGRTSLTWVGYSEPMTIIQGTFTSSGGTNQIADAWYVYGKSEGDGLTVNSMKCSGAVGGISLEGCHGAVLNGLISTRVRLEECASIDIVGMHNESMMTTHPGNVVIRSSDVNFYGGIMYMTRPEMQDITLADSKGMVLITDSHNERASTVSYNDMVTAYFQRSPYITDPLDPPIHLEYCNPGTRIKVRNHKSVLISIGSPGVWRPTVSRVISSRVAAANLETVYAKNLIASGDFMVVNGGNLAYASNGSPANMKIVPYSGSIFPRRALTPSTDLALYGDNGVGTGGLGVSGTTYYYTVAFRNAAGQYTSYMTPVSRATMADRTMRLRITNPNNDCVAVIWRKNGAGVETTPDWYVEIPITSAVTWLLDMGPHIGGWTWLAGAGRIPSTVAASNTTTAGILVDGVAI